MTMDRNYDKPEPAREDVEQWPGPAVLEFGAGWCPHCQGAQPAIAAALDDYPAVRHVKVGDGKGKPLGRSFQVKLWPTLIFLQDGQEKARAVRPTSEDEVRRGLEAIASG
jgi:thioredoxin 1